MSLTSIILPCYNVESYLPRAIESVLAQTNPNFELLIVIDGSPDNSKIIAQEYALKDSRIKVFEKAHVYLNFSCVLVFQKLFKNYLYASAYTYDEFKLSKSGTAGNYDLLISKAIKTGSLEYFITGLDLSRMGKTISITKYPITYNKLNVCVIASHNPHLKDYKNNKNCSRCFKCIRTMAYLDIIGKLNNYKNVFDLEDYYKSKDKYLGNLLYMKYRANNIFSKELFEEVKNRNLKLNKKVYYYAIIRIFRPILNKLKHSQ